MWVPDFIFLTDTFYLLTETCNILHIYAFLKASTSHFIVIQLMLVFIQAYLNFIQYILSVYIFSFVLWEGLCKGFTRILMKSFSMNNIHNYAISILIYTHLYVYVFLSPLYIDPSHIRKHFNTTTVLKTSRQFLKTLYPIKTQSMNEIYIFFFMELSPCCFFNVRFLIWFRQVK